MDIREQIIQEYLTQGGGFRKLAEKYGVSRTTDNSSDFPSIYSSFRMKATTSVNFKMDE